ncbi:carbohydrate kinase [Calidifontibacter sp. DB0510]|uniref:Carbohydrate kinase n=1 Tax=Metallococcus carri TaxID=1656884 RepID=A0A967B0F5_9MICO|nr:PfkB family carbohydrate kinase [Metallococcus carri]NHN55130.1 carbohydrate kinase [Metallococcus carri]NOP36207.1 carbohydrate kinase [Calidifontibacter sp. DB2511S]
MAARTLVVGEALVDVVRSPDGSVREHVGGSPLNVAIGLARLGHPVELATWIGRDAHGAAITEHLAADSVPLVTGSDDAARTATAVATVNESGSASYEFDIDWQLPYAVPRPPSHLHTGSIAAVLQPGASQVRDIVFAAREVSTISFDPNARPSLMGRPEDARQDIEQLVGLADVVKASDEDIAWLYGEDAPAETVLRLWAGLGPSLVVLTRGAEGASAYVNGEAEVQMLPGRSVQVADTVGAGDSFMSGLLSGLLDAGLLGGRSARERLRSARWDDLRPAVERAIQASAITVSRAGAQPPTRAEITPTVR